LTDYQYDDDARSPGLKSRYSPAAGPGAPSAARRLPLLLARAVAWLVVPLYVAGISALVWLERLLGVQDENPAEGMVIAVGFGAFAVVGAVLVARRPANLIGWILAVLALMVGLFPAGDAYAAYVMTTRGEPNALAVAGAWIQSWYWLLLLGLAFVYLPLLFPDGRLPSRRWLPVAVFGAVGTLVPVVLGMLTDVLTGQDVDYRIDNPIGIEGLAHVEDLPIFGVLGIFLIVGVLGAVASVVVRFRRSRGVERQQMKWFLYAAALIPLGPALDYLSEPLSGVWFGLVLIALPTAIGIAVLRYRLYDIDLVINRTLVYGALTACVVGFYVLAVGGLGALFRARGDLAVSLLATGIVAVLFAPLRDRLQRAVNRLMYGERDDPYAVLSRLGRRLEATLVPEAALETIVETVAQALKLPYAAITLEQNGEFVLAAEHGEPVKTPLVLPLAYQGEPVGRLILALRAPSEALSAPDRRLLDDLARQAGVAAHAVRLTADLQRSRERLVTAREEERRRLRRDLHDGLGPRLAAQTLKVGSARSLYPRDSATADALLMDLESDMEAAISDIRRLVHNLRPPALDELGLVGALNDAAAQYDTDGLRVRVEAPESEALPPLPAAVEVAAYRIAQEALTNVVRHAGARNCTVRLSLDDGLGLEVTDDGVGLPADRAAGVGLASMRERAAELGGECVTEALPTGGTRVFARLPLPGSEPSDEEVGDPGHEEPVRGGA
jgi:signal transduction histidine kinase